nr:MAG TPA: hypothetical protein [Caudoviricetes sp.]
MGWGVPRRWPVPGTAHIRPPAVYGFQGFCWSGQVSWFWVLAGGVRWGCDLRLCAMAWVTISLVTYPLGHW